MPTITVDGQSKEVLGYYEDREFKNRINLGDTITVDGQSKATLGVQITPDSITSFKVVNKNSPTMSKGTGSPTFTRASKANVIDFEGRLVQVQDNSPSYPGLRAVSNLLTYSEDFSNAAWVKTFGGAGATIPVLTAGQSDPDGGTTAWRLQAHRGIGTTSGDYSLVYQNVVAANVSKNNRISVWARSRTGSNQNVAIITDATFGVETWTVTPVWKRFTILNISVKPASNYFQIGTYSTFGQQDIDIDIWHPLYEDLTGATNQNPGEYVATTSAPVTKWFDYANPYTVDGNGVVTDSGVRTPAYTSQGYLSEPAGTNIFSNPLAPATQGITVTAVQHTLSFYGTGSIVATGTASFTLNGTGANNRVTQTFTPTAGTLTLTLSGSVTSPQLETGAVATSPMLSSAATSTRAATALSYPVSGNLPAGKKVITGKVTFNGFAGGYDPVIWSSYQDANNYVQILYYAPNFILFLKRIAGVNYSADRTITTPIVGQTYTYRATINADNTMAVSWDGSAEATQANTTAPVFGTTFQLGSQNGASQPVATFGELKILSA